MTTTQDPDTRDLPFHLKGNFAPVFDEVTLTDLAVLGQIPGELRGRFLRIGANPKSGRSPHWFFGNGMIHGVELREGKANWYRNRYVRTPSLNAQDDALKMNHDGSFDRISSLANTHVISHAGKIMALEEGHFPWLVSPDLETIGYHDFGGKLTTAMTAHPKTCPETGELLFFGYHFMPPFLTYHRVSAAGELIQSEPISVRGPTMMHDFNVTRNHVIFMDLPVVFDLELAMSGEMPFHWDDDYGARLGVMARNGTDADVEWYEVEPCYVFHPMNAFERDGGNEIVLDVGRFPKLWVQNSDFAEYATLHRWVIDRSAGKVREEPLDDRPAEFARVADSVVGLPNRYGYMTATRRAGGDAVFANELIKYDLRAGTAEVHDFGAGRAPGEAVPAVRPGASSEDDGWIMTFVYDSASDTSEMAIVSTEDFSAPPVARIRLPRRVPFGFHGSWIADPQ